VLNPALILGKSYTTQEAYMIETLIDILTSRKVAVHDICLPIVDIDDVVAAHINALESKINGERIALVSGTITEGEISHILSESYQSYGYHVQ